MKKLISGLAALAAIGSLAFTAYAFECADVPAGPIWNNEDAKGKCPVACAAAGGTWNGMWRTVIAGTSSVCGCC